MRLEINLPRVAGLALIVAWVALAILIPAVVPYAVLGIGGEGRKHEVINR